MLCSPTSIPTMLSVHCEQLNKTGFPTVHAVVLLEGTMNLTGETQPLVEQLMMVKRMQVQKWHLVLLLRVAWDRGTGAALQLCAVYLPVLILLQGYGRSCREQREPINTFAGGSGFGCGWGRRFIAFPALEHFVCVPCSASPPRSLCWRSGRPVLWVSSSPQRARRS